MASTSSFQPTSCPEVEIALSTEEIAPRYLHPEQEADPTFVQTLLAKGPPSPRSARSFLDNYGASLSSEDAVTMAKKLAQLAVDREDTTNMRVKHVTALAHVASQAHREQTYELETALASLKDRLAELESRLADSDTPILPLAPHCPPDFTENVGLVPDFYIREDGMRLLARYVCRVPGTNLVQGTLGGPGARIHSHELQALPSIVSDTPPEVLPCWFVQSMAANQPAFPILLASAEATGDWGLTADIQYYHDTDVKLEETQAYIRELQAEADLLAIQRRTAHYRLAQADAGNRLASTEAISPFFQEGSSEGRNVRGKTRGRVFGK
jgi:hypothetical protein